MRAQKAGNEGETGRHLVDELLRVLGAGAKDYGEIMPAVQELQARAAEGARLRAAMDGALDKPVEGVEKEQGS